MDSQCSDDIAGILRPASINGSGKIHVLEPKWSRTASMIGGFGIVLPRARLVARDIIPAASLGYALSGTLPSMPENKAPPWAKEMIAMRSMLLEAGCNMGRCEESVRVCAEPCGRFHVYGFWLRLGDWREGASEVFGGWERPRAPAWGPGSALPN